MEEQQVVPAEQSKEHFIKLADKCATLLDTIGEMSEKIVRSEVSSADQKNKSMNDLAEAFFKIHCNVVEQLESHVSSYYADNDVDLQRFLVKCKRNHLKVIAGMIKSLRYLMESQCKTLSLLE